MTQKGRRTRRTYFERHHQLHCHELAKLVEMSTKQQKINEHINYKMIRKMIFKKVYMIGWWCWWMAQWVKIGKISAKNECMEVSPGSHFCCEDVLMQKKCTNNSASFQKDIFFLRQLLSDIIINEVPFKIALFNYFYRTMDKSRLRWATTTYLFGCIPQSLFWIWVMSSSQIQKSNKNSYYMNDRDSSC